MIDWVSIVRQSTNRRISNCIYLVPRGRRQRHKRERIQQQHQLQAEAAAAAAAAAAENDIYEDFAFGSGGGCGADDRNDENRSEQSSFAASTVCCFMRVSLFFILSFFPFVPVRSEAQLHPFILLLAALIHTHSQ